MEPVTTGEGVAYGLRLISYVFGLGIVIWLSAVGAFASIQNGNALFAVVIALVATVVVLAGLLGLVYKVISDGVQSGMLKAMS